MTHNMPAVSIQVMLTAGITYADISIIYSTFAELNRL